MRWLQSLFSRTHQGGKAAIILAFFTLVSQVLALLRDVLLARTVGVGDTLDLYFSAFRVPDMLYVVLSSFVAATVLVPLLYEKEREGGDSEQEFIGSILQSLLVVSILLVSLVWMLVPYLAQVLLPNTSESLVSEYIHITRILLLSPLLLTISAFFGSINQKTHTYFSFAISPVVYNLGILFGIVFLYPHMGVQGLVLGVVLGCVMHVLVQFLGAARYTKGVLRGNRGAELKHLSRLAKFSLPRSAALFFGQVQMFVLVGSIAYVGSGSVSAFFFAYNLQSVFLSLIGATISVASFSTLTKAFADQDFEGYHVSLSQGIRTILFFSLPVTVLGIILSPEIARIVFGFSAEHQTSAQIVPLLFAATIVSISFQSLSLLLARAHYAAKNSAIPLFAQILPTVLFGLLYVYGTYSNVNGSTWFLVFGAILFSVAAMLQCIILYTSLSPSLLQRKALSPELKKIFTAALVGMIIVLVVNTAISKTFILSSFFAILAKSIGITICFVIPYIWVLQKLESKEFLQIKHAITTRFKH